MRPWRTGDLGEIDAEGLLTVLGRKDNLIVTAFGRNISPEWVETMLLGDDRIAFCAVLGHGEPHLTALLIPAQILAGEPPVDPFAFLPNGSYLYCAHNGAGGPAGLLEFIDPGATPLSHAFYRLAPSL